MKQAQPINRWLALLAVTLAFLPIVLDMTILHVAIPSLTLALHASGTEVLWIIDIYPLLMASLLIPMGTLADRIGHRRLLLLGLFFFLMGSVFAAFSPTVSTLISARAVMAVGGAMIIPCTLAIIRLTFSDERERAIALGTWGAVASAGAAVGPLVGGLLLEHFWWGSVFLINAPVMLLVFPLVFAYTPRSVLRGDANWTIGQALVLMVGLMVSVYAIKSGFKPDSTLPMTIGLLVVGLSLLTWFVHRQLHAANPMLDMSLFSKPAISAGVVMALVVMGSLAGVELMLAQELQFVLGMTPLQAGLFMLPLMVGSGVGGPFAGWILGLVGLRAVATLSLLAAAASLLGLALSSFADAGVGVILLLGVLGMALGIGLTASSVAIMSSTPPEKAGSAGALEATSYDLGTGLGITGFGLVLTSSYQKSIHLPADIAPEIAASATHSIGETMLAAHDLIGAQGQALIDAGKRAFSTSHSMVLLSAAILIGILSAVIFYILRHHRAQTAAT